MKKIVNLTSVCPEAIKNLEALFYEVTTKEKILSLALNQTDLNKSTSSMFDKFYEEYKEIYKQYTNAQQSFYKEYVIQHEENHSTWEIQFDSGDLILYD